MKQLVSAVLTLGVLCPALDAAAHFQLLYTPESALTRGQATHLIMVFTHPFTTEPTMDMGAPLAFSVTHQRGDAAPATTDLLEFVRPVEWHGTANRAAAFEARLPARVTRSLGDYVFVLTPAPYYEEPEDKYIQQITRTMLNVGGVPGNWAEPMGLPAEILPLSKPYANWVGGVFRGVVLSEGQPVPHAEIEVEYVNHPPEMEGSRFRPAAEVNAPQDAFKIATLYANAAGEFTIGLPRSGWWGICALAVGPDTEFQGKALSQDAVLWLQVKDMADFEN